MALITFENLPSTNTPLNAANLNNNFNELNTKINDINEKLNNSLSWKKYAFSTGGNSIDISNLEFDAMLVTLEVSHNDGYVVVFTVEIPDLLQTGSYKYYDAGGNDRSYARFGVNQSLVTLNEVILDGISYRTSQNAIMTVFYKGKNV